MANLASMRGRRFRTADGTVYRLDKQGNLRRRTGPGQWEVVDNVSPTWASADDFEHVPEAVDASLWCYLHLSHDQTLFAFYSEREHAERMREEMSSHGVRVSRLFKVEETIP